MNAIGLAGASAGCFITGLFCLGLAKAEMNTATTAVANDDAAPELLANRSVNTASKTTAATAAVVAEALPALVTAGHILALCEKIGNKLGSVSVADCNRLQLADSGHHSHEGNALAVKVYPPKSERAPIGRVLLLGGVHGDEYSSVSIVFKWMDILEEHHSGLFHWRVSPLVNPDGLLREKSQRMNGRGVDLNRNFPTPTWDRDAIAYWTKRGKRPRRYPGPAANSEPETQWLVKEIDEFKPDIIVQVHAPYGIVDFDGPYEPPTKLGRLRLYLMGTYPGSLGNYGGVVNGIPVVTIELPSAGRMPSKAEIDKIWTDLIRWLQKNLRETKAARAERERALQAAEAQRAAAAKSKAEKAAAESRSKDKGNASIKPAPVVGPAATRPAGYASGKTERAARAQELSTADKTADKDEAKPE